jgi:hypothetical protein
MKNFSFKEIRFSGDSIKSCIGFIDLVDSTKNTITMVLSIQYYKIRLFSAGIGINLLYTYLC